MGRAVQSALDIKPEIRNLLVVCKPPVPVQRFESIAIDIFDTLPETTKGIKWIVKVENYASKRFELFPLKQATAKEFAITLQNEVFLRRKKNRDLKPRSAMMVDNNHTLWIEKLPAIRFALNTAKCESTDHTTAYLTFARELRNSGQRFERYVPQIKENIEMSQDRQKIYADKSRRLCPNYKVNDLVCVKKLHPLSKTSQNRSAKLMPNRDGPYIVLFQRSPSTFVVASCDKPDAPLGVYHTSALTPFSEWHIDPVSCSTSQEKRKTTLTAIDS
ncbi:pro-Pol polyprotein [Trichonephila clavipes]|nr:pro-Pol polyprotein [Trichonephila clavipes]